MNEIDALPLNWNDMIVWIFVFQDWTDDEWIKVYICCCHTCYAMMFVENRIMASWIWLWTFMISECVKLYQDEKMSLILLDQWLENYSDELQRSECWMKWGEVEWHDLLNSFLC